MKSYNKRQFLMKSVHFHKKRCFLMSIERSFDKFH